MSEAGASVYSASELAAKEFPDLDVSLRGAVSIARRLQDPLAELVKIEPKAIGVGQYQHDVDQHRLGRSLDAVVEDAVNAVGVDLNTASAPLLAPCLGARAVARRGDRRPPRRRTGAFRSRKDAARGRRGSGRAPSSSAPASCASAAATSRSTPRRCIRRPTAWRGGSSPACGRDLRALMGDEARLRAIDPADFVDARFGLPTVRDILAELAKPGRDPRPAFETASFAEGVEEIADLKPGMLLEGTVTNVAAFGAFVDIGVHQDGLVHVSQLADRFVKDPHEVVKAGDVVKVRVVEVDVARKRIGLTMRKDGGREETPRAEHGGRQGSAAAGRGRAADAGAEAAADRQLRRGAARRAEGAADSGLRPVGAEAPEQALGVAAENSRLP